MRLRAALFALLLPLPAVLGACAADMGEEPEVSEDEAELAASRIQVVGAIEPGVPVNVAYTKTPRYRALTFAAKKGDQVEVWVRSTDGGNAYAYLLRPSFSTLSSNDDANATTKDARVRATIATAGTYYVALRDVGGRSGTFRVELSINGAGAVDAGPAPDAAPPADAGPAPDATPPADAGTPVGPECTGTPRFPTTGPLNAKDATRDTYERDCDPYGVCTPWTRTSRTPTSAGTMFGPTSVDPSRYARLEFSLGTYMSQQGSSTYLCNLTDRDANWSTRLDERGQADAYMERADRCNIAGGSGGPSSLEPRRRVHISFGSTCMSIVEEPPAQGYGHQMRQAYTVTFD